MPRKNINARKRHNGPSGARRMNDLGFPGRRLMNRAKRQARDGQLDTSPEAIARRLLDQ